MQMIQGKIIKSFVKRKGRKISEAKLLIIKEKLPEISINENFNCDNLKKIISANKNINFEIGYGSGEHLLYQAKNNPNEIFIGCEPYFNGTVKLITEIIREKINNIYIYQDDALDLLENLPDNYLKKIFILFPDPWPKTKHHKRRIINEKNISLFLDKLKNNATLRLATDHQEYANWMLAKLMKEDGFKWEIDNVRDWHKKPLDWISTKYQLKALAGNNYYFFNFCKK